MCISLPLHINFKLTAKPPPIPRPSFLCLGICSLGEGWRSDLIRPVLESCTPGTLQRFEDADPVRAIAPSRLEAEEMTCRPFSTLRTILKVRVPMPPRTVLMPVQADILPRVSSADIWKRLFLKEFPIEAHQYESNALEEPESWRDELFVRSPLRDCSHYQ